MSWNTASPGSRLYRLAAEGPILPPAPRHGRSYLLELALRCKVPVDLVVPCEHPELTHALYLPALRVVLAATDAAAPLLETECRRIAISGQAAFLLLLRVPAEGVPTIAIWEAEASCWREDYRLVSIAGHSLMIPADPTLPAFALSALGIFPIDVGWWCDLPELARADPPELDATTTGTASNR